MVSGYVRLLSRALAKWCQNIVADLFGMIKWIIFCSIVCSAFRLLRDTTGESNSSETTFAHLIPIQPAEAQAPDITSRWVNSPAVAGHRHRHHRAFALFRHSSEVFPCHGSLLPSPGKGAGAEPPHCAAGHVDWLLERCRLPQFMPNPCNSRQKQMRLLKPNRFGYVA